MNPALQRLLATLQGVRRSGKGWMARCPAHIDRKPSLSISEKAGKVLIHCHGGCTIESICAAVGFEMRELFPPKRTRRRIVAEYDYLDEGGNLLNQVVRFDPKDFRQRRPDGRGGWVWNLQGVRRVLFRLPELLPATDVLVCEGERDCETARSLGLVATTNAGGAGKWINEYSESLCGKRVTIIADADQPGRKHAQQVAESLQNKAASVNVLELPGAKDLTEWVEKGGTRNALLSRIQNDSERKPQVPEGSTILESIVAYIRRFVALSESQACLVALWTVHTHVFSAGDATPYLAVTSAEKRSGKTRLLEVLETLVANPWMTGRVTAAVLTRKIDMEHPTLLLDESDAAFSGEKEYAEALRGVLNSGHRTGGKTSCCVGQGGKISYRDFSTFCAKAIAGIGKLPDTVADRSIPIRLKRARSDERVERFRLRDIKVEATSLRQQIDLWCKSIAAQLRDARPELPPELTDRQQDGAEPLLAIADIAGGKWACKARTALIQILTSQAAADESIRVRLLADIFGVFNSKRAERLSSSDIVKELLEIESSPWAGFNQGKPLTPVCLARLLKPFEVAPRSIRLADGSTPKGYHREWFEDVWTRYLRLPESRSPEDPESETPPPPQCSISARSTYLLESRQKQSVGSARSEESLVNMRAVADVAVAGALTNGREQANGAEHNISTSLEQGVEALVRHAKEPIALLARRRCYVHGWHDEWWQRRAGSEEWVCGKCHPSGLQLDKSFPKSTLYEQSGSVGTSRGFQHE
jgi:5S rRNA maturation endonuclease (ribonuclease M5)